jgi:hypothetical protein
MGTRGTAFQLLYQKLRHIAKMQAAVAEYRRVRQEYEALLRSPKWSYSYLSNTG